MLLKRAALIVAFFPQIAFGQQVINDDLLVKSSLCVGASCTENMDFGYTTMVLSGDAPSLLFKDTSSIGSFPTTDWSISTSSGNFVITNEDASTAVFQFSSSGTGVALGGSSTLVANAVSVGSDGGERRIVYLADGVASTDAATYGQLSSAIANSASANTAIYLKNQSELSRLSGELNSVGAMASAFSALSANPKSANDHQLTIGLGAYGGQRAFAIGTYHFLDNDKVMVNTGFAQSFSSGATPAFRLGISFGG